MASLLGPQWLCECNKSGGAEDVHSAGVLAARHFLDHGVAGSTGADNTEGNFHSVSVYRERNEWLYTISTPAEAERIAYPIREVAVAPPGSTTITTSMQLPPGSMVQVDSGLGAPQTYTYTLSDPLARPPQMFRPSQGIELGSLSLEEASAQFNAMVDQMRAQTYRSIRPGL